MKYLNLLMETEAVSKNTIGKEPSKPSKAPFAGFAGKADGDIERKAFPIGTRPESAFPFGGWVIEEAWKGEMLQAKKVYSRILGAELWLIFERAFDPLDRFALYYPVEIPLLWDKTPKELRRIHKVKVAFPGCRVIQEGPDGQREGKGNALPKLEDPDPKR